MLPRARMYLKTGLFFCFSLTAPFAVAVDAASESRRPIDAFQGCESQLPQQNQAPAQTAEAAPTKSVVDPKSQLEFLSYSLEELDEENIDPVEGDCWFRLDGVWAERSRIKLDDSFQPPGWQSMRNGEIKLANGTYEDIDHIVIEPSSDSNTHLVIRSVLAPAGPVRFVSRDGTELGEVLERGGKRKTYRAVGDAGSLGRELVIEMERTGSILLTMDNKRFARPKPGTKQSEWEGQISSNDPFMIGFNLDNLAASRSGYDVVLQDPNDLMSDRKGFVFAKTKSGYEIAEKMIVPRGLRLDKPNMQGMVFHSTNVSSEREFQEMSSSNMGNSTRIGLSGSATKRKEKSDKSVNIEAGHAWGSSSAKDQFNSMTTSGAVAEESGVMRYKKYALIVDHAYIELSDGFINAVDRTRRYGEYDKLIEEFGTHYAYAMTYGAAGWLKQTITSQAYIKQASNTNSSESNQNTSFVVGNAESYRSDTSTVNNRTTERNEYGERTFEAVGGNGSWNEAGFSAGDSPYPILADMRPLDELLNPINFPNEPDVYERVRFELADAIQNYLLQHANLSAKSSLPTIKPQPATQTYRVHISKMICGHYGNDNEGEGLELLGALALRHRDAGGNAKTRYSFRKGYNAGVTRFLECPKGRWKFKPTSKNRVTITGTPAQLKRHSFSIHAELWDWDSPPFDPHDQVSGKSPLYTIPALRPGQSKSQGWALRGGPHNVHLGIYLQFTRTR